MEPKKIIIVGGGMAGLCAGSYLRMNGYDVTISTTRKDACKPSPSLF